MKKFKLATTCSLSPAIAISGCLLATWCKHNTKDPKNYVGNWDGRLTICKNAYKY